MDFSKPSDVTDAECSFGYGNKKLMPSMSMIPEEFHRGMTPWNNLFGILFYRGAKGQFIPKPGIDKTKALRHLKALMASWEPKHEHKEAACAWVMSLWFSEFREEAV